MAESDSDESFEGFSDVGSDIHVRHWYLFRCIECF